MGALITGAVNGVEKEELLSERYSPAGSTYWKEYPLVPEIDEVDAGSYKHTSARLCLPPGRQVHPPTSTRRVGLRLRCGPMSLAARNSCTEHAQATVRVAAFSTAQARA